MFEGGWLLLGRKILQELYSKLEKQLEGYIKCQGGFEMKVMSWILKNAVNKYQLRGEVVESPSWEVFKDCLVTILCLVLWDDPAAPDDPVRILST